MVASVTSRPMPRSDSRDAVWASTRSAIVRTCRVPACRQVMTHISQLCTRAHAVMQHVRIGSKSGGSLTGRSSWVSLLKQQLTKHPGSAHLGPHELAEHHYFVEAVEHLGPKETLRGCRRTLVL